jgi:serine/threonine-protein kinase RsbW
VRTPMPIRSTELLGETSPNVLFDEGAPGAAGPADELKTASLTLPGQACQVRVARRWLAGLVAGLPAADDIVLAASELAANAVSHSRSGEANGTFTIRAVVGPDVVRVEVTDVGGPWRTGPVCDDASPDNPGQLHQTRRDLDLTGGELYGRDLYGRGLAIVARLASAWGVNGDYSGRTAWCELPRQPDGLARVPWAVDAQQATGLRDTH